MMFLTTNGGLKMKKINENNMKKETPKAVENKMDELERLREEVKLLQSANDGLRTNVNLYAFRQRHFPEVEAEKIRLAERLNASSQAYSKLKAEKSSVTESSAQVESQEELWMEALLEESWGQITYLKNNFILTR